MTITNWRQYNEKTINAVYSLCNISMETAFIHVIAMLAAGLWQV